MTDFYAARGLFWPLRPENMIKCALQSASGQICMGKSSVQNERFYFSGFRKAQDVQIFSGGPFASNAIPEKNWARTEEGAGVKNK